MGFRGDHTKMCHSGMWIILSWKQARLKRFRKNRWTSPLLLKEFKIEGLFQEVAITIDDYQKVCTQRHREESAAAAAAKSLQSCPTLCDHIDRSPPGSSVRSILQARILEWVAVSFSGVLRTSSIIPTLMELLVVVISSSSSYYSVLTGAIIALIVWVGLKGNRCMRKEQKYLDLHWKLLNYLYLTVCFPYLVCRGL